MVMADSMKRADSVDPVKFLPAIGQTKYDGVTAMIEFDALGDLKGGAISIYKYTGGKLEYVETLGGSPMETAKADIKADVKEAVSDVKDAAKAVAGAATAVGKEAVGDVKDAAKAATAAGKDAVKAGAEAVKNAADATKAAVDKK
jgi:branched-chain amino acid transport system substrate-binding protein